MPSSFSYSAIINNGGTALVSGVAESHSVEIGSGGAGGVSIENGGELFAYLALKLGRDAGDVGDMRIDGANSAFSAPTHGHGDLIAFVGLNGVGNIAVTNAAAFLWRRLYMSRSVRAVSPIC